MDGGPSTGPGLGRGNRDAAGKREGASLRGRGPSGVSPAGRNSFRVTAAPLGLCPALSRPRCPPGAEHELRGRQRLRVDEGAVKIEREVGRHAGVGGPAVPGVIDEREERNAQRVARSAGGARLGDVCSLLLDPGRLGCAVQFAVTCCPGVNACQLRWENPANSASFCTRICTQHASGCVLGAGEQRGERRRDEGGALQPAREGDAAVGDEGFGENALMTVIVTLLAEDPAAASSK